MTCSHMPCTCEITGDDHRVGPECCFVTHPRADGAGDIAGVAAAAA